MNIVLQGGVILTPEGELHNQLVYIKDGIIEDIVQDRMPFRPGFVPVKLEGRYISPGFIDIHTHGAMGADASAGPYEAMAEFHLSRGTTGFLPALWNHDINSLASAFRNISEFMQHQQAGARVLGINSEGPFLNPERGAQHRDRRLIPDEKTLRKLLDAAQGNLKIMTLSAEVEGCRELIGFLRGRGVRAALGYCSASAIRLTEARRLGINHIDHIFNCFSDPAASEGGVKPWGIEEEMLLCDDLPAEVIADRQGIHVPPVWLNILLRCKGPKGIILISDSRDPAGLPPGRYTMADGMEAVTVGEDDTVRIASGGLAGTRMGLDDALRNFIAHTGIPLYQAAAMVSRNPAQVLGIQDRKGSVKIGMDADITVLDKDLSVAMTLLEGRTAYVNPASGLQLPER